MGFSVAMTIVIGTCGVFGGYDYIKVSLVAMILVNK
jgi:hypothetical protein